MRFHVEPWAPEYGAAADEAAFAPSDANVDPAVELEPAQWRPVPATGPVATDVAFVDGVRRIVAHVWIEDEPATASGVSAVGETRHGICVTYAAGAVRSNGSAALVAAEVAHGLFTTAVSASPIRTRHAEFRVNTCAADSVEQLSIEVQNRMATLEGLIAKELGDAELVVLDGPLRGREFAAGALGYVKTHRTAYLPPDLQQVIASLRPGERSPVFLLDSAGFTRFSWYLRLPSTSVGSPFSATVRCELAPDVAASCAVATANLTAATLPRFASHEHREPRAPQNLYPIAGLERALRRRLGDPRLLYRSLRAAAVV